MKGMNNMMKKTAALFAALFVVTGAVSIAPAAATTQGSIAIIDVNFDASLIPGDVLEVCATTDFACNSTPQLRTTTQYRAYNHGTIMADIVRANNPNAKLILVEAGTSPTGVITGVQLDLALDWIINNREQYNIQAVSFSYNSGNGARCMPVSPGVRVDVTHNNIVSDIAQLKNAGTTFYAASGNYGSGDRIDYPACITDVVAVGSTLYRGSQAQSDVVVSGFTYTSDVLKSNFTSLQDRRVIGDAGRYPVRVGNTTSVATAITAATATPAVSVVAPEPEPEPAPSPRELLGASLDSASLLLKSVTENVKSDAPLDKANADKLITDLKELIAELESVYNN